MLEQELWKRLPALPGRQLDFGAALEGNASQSATQGFDCNSFSDWVDHGNPWKRQAPGQLCPFWLSTSQRAVFYSHYSGSPPIQ